MEPTIEDYQILASKLSAQRNVAFDALAQAETTVDKLNNQITVMQEQIKKLEEGL